MYVLWWAIALLMLLLFILLEWKLWRSGVERVYDNKRVVLRGSHWHYMASAFSIGFIGFTGAFLGLMNYAGIQYPNLACWLTGSLIVGVVNLISVGTRLKYFDFGNNGVDS